MLERGAHGRHPTWDAGPTGLIDSVCTAAHRMLSSAYQSSSQRQHQAACPYMCLDVFTRRLKRHAVGYIRIPQPKNAAVSVGVRSRYQEPEPQSEYCYHRPPGLAAPHMSTAPAWLGCGGLGEWGRPLRSSGAKQSTCLLGRGGPPSQTHPESLLLSS